MVDDPLPIPAGFDLERARYNSGIKGPWGLLKSSFNFTITGGPAQHLSEMCFHEKHPEFTVIKAIQKNELGRVETVRLEVKNLEYTYEIYCWILGLGSQITVHGPSTVVKHLRGEK